MPLHFYLFLHQEVFAATFLINLIIFEKNRIYRIILASKEKLIVVQFDNQPNSRIYPFLRC